MKNFFCLLLFFLGGCGKPDDKQEQKPLVLVSIAPYQFLVEQIARGKVAVESIVPPNTNPHIFEPTPKQTARTVKGEIWFLIGESFEDRIGAFLKERKPDLIFCDLRDTVSLIEETHHACRSCSKDHLDRHIWMNPKLALVQAEKIAEILSAKWPEKKSFFAENLYSLKKDLLQLDDEIKALLQPVQNSSLLVSHPAFGYFCKEYGLKQLSIEQEGKDPRPRHLEKIVEEAQLSGLKIAVTLPQYNNKATLLIARKLHLHTEMIDPYSSDYIATMKQLAEAIAR